MSLWEWLKSLFGSSYKGWRIGPVIDGRNRSPGLPERITSSFDFPQPSQIEGHVHYVTRDCGPLSGTLRLRYRIEAEDGVRFPCKDYPDVPGLITLYFQRRGDNWGAEGKYETYRWFAVFATQRLAIGEHTLEASLDDPRWTAINTSSATSAPAAFTAAKANAGRVGFVFGGGDGFGHGVYATGPAQFVLVDWSAA